MVRNQGIFSVILLSTSELWVAQIIIIIIFRPWSTNLRAHDLLVQSQEKVTSTNKAIFRFATQELEPPQEYSGTCRLRKVIHNCTRGCSPDRCLPSR